MSDPLTHARRELDGMWALFFGPNPREFHTGTPSLEKVAYLEDVAASVHAMIVRATIAARLEGATWSQIAAAKDISRQAAAKSYGPVVQMYRDRFDGPHIDGEQPLPLDEGDQR